MEHKTQSKGKSKKVLRPTIKKDGIHPADYLKYRHACACEDCTHYKASDQSCTIGYVTLWHRREVQESEYERTGKMALCRFLEID